MKKKLSSLNEIFLQAAADSAQRNVFFERQDGQWVGVTGAEHIQNVVNTARTFIQSGLNQGDQILIMALNSYAWQVAEHAALLAGLEIIGVETHAKEDHISSLLQQLNIQAVIFDQESSFQKLHSCGLGPIRLAMSMEDLKRTMKSQDHSSSFVVPELSLQARATIIFTSGTTGTPKGIRYNQAHLVDAFQAIVENFEDIQSSDRTLSWLPMANLFQRILNLCAFVKGVPVYFVSHPQEIMKVVSEVKPTVMIAVPRFFEKVYKSLHKKIQWMPSQLRAFAMQKMGAFLRRQMGGQIRFFISGSAQCNPEYLKYFSKIGMPIFEAYGMSESVIPLALNNPRQNRMGSVGRALSCNSIKISEEGEILVKTPSLASHYIGKENESLLSSDGYLATGDKGYVDKDGYLYIQGRLNDLVKTSTGRKLNLSQLDQKFAGISFAEQVVSLAENLPGVFLVLAGVSKDDKGQVKAIEKQIQQINATLPSYEQVRQVIYLEKPLSIEDGTLTNNLKVRRKVLAARCEKMIREA